MKKEPIPNSPMGFGNFFKFVLTMLHVFAYIIWCNIVDSIKKHTSWLYPIVMLSIYGWISYTGMSASLPKYPLLAGLFGVLVTILATFTLMEARTLRKQISVDRPYGWREQTTVVNSEDNFEYALGHIRDENFANDEALSAPYRVFGFILWSIVAIAIGLFLNWCFRQ